MASKQTRRSISVSGKTYASLCALRGKTGLALSAMAEQAFAGYMARELPSVNEQPARKKPRSWLRSGGAAPIPVSGAPAPACEVAPVQSADSRAGQAIQATQPLRALFSPEMLEVASRMARELHPDDCNCAPCCAARAPRSQSDRAHLELARPTRRRPDDEPPAVPELGSGRPGPRPADEVMSSRVGGTVLF